MPTVEQKIRAIARKVDRKTAREGRQWYRRTRDEVDAMLTLAGFDPSEHGERGCAVLAALSPRVSFARNVELTRMFFQLAYLKGGEAPTLAECKLHKMGLTQSLKSAIDCWERSHAALNGPKVKAFSEAVDSSGKYGNTPVLDVHALRAAGIEGQPRKRERAEVEQAYRTVAEDCGMTVHQLQAAVWCVQRGAAW